MQGTSRAAGSQVLLLSVRSSVRVRFLPSAPEREDALWRAGTVGAAQRLPFPAPFPHRDHFQKFILHRNYLFRNLILRFLKNVARYLIILNGQMFQSFIAIKSEHCSTRTAWKHLLKQG